MRSTTVGIGWRWAIGLALLLALILAGYAIREALPPFLLGAGIAYVVAPPVEGLSRRGMRRTWAILVVYALFGLLAAAIIVFVMPVFVADLSRLAEVIPRYIHVLEGVVNGWERRFHRLPLPVGVKLIVETNAQQLEAAIMRGLGDAIGGVFSLIGGIDSIILAPILAFYLLEDLPRLRRKVSAAIPSGVRPQVMPFLAEVDRVLGGFIRGQLAVACLVGLLTGAVMALLGLPFPIILGLIAAVTNLVPYFGPIVGAVPGILLALSVSATLAVKAAVAYVIIQQLEAAVLVPRIVGKTVGLHPLVLIFALLVGGHLFGFAGLILAVPLAGVSRAIVMVVHAWVISVLHPGSRA